jgi:hypothetical protein
MIAPRIASTLRVGGLSLVIVSVVTSLVIACGSTSDEPPSNGGPEAGSSSGGGNTSIDGSSSWEGGEGGEGGNATPGSPHTPATGCRTGFQVCGNVCADVTTDTRHCGGCNAQCATPCVGGACAASGSAIECRMRCDGVCTTTRAIDHCGSCFNRCNDSELCSDNACVPTQGTGVSCESPLITPGPGEYEFRFSSSPGGLPRRFPCGPLQDVPVRWFRYTAEKSSSESEASILGEDFVLELFSGTCENLVSLGCSVGAAGQEFEFNGIAGQTYFVAVGRVASTSTKNPAIKLKD